MKLFENESAERLIYYPAKDKKSALTVVIFPGGAYAFLADHEGRGYAEYLNRLGYDCFVCLYRVSPCRFPLELIDARRAIRLVRVRAAEFGIDQNKIMAMGSSAGGSLVSLLCTCTDTLEGETEENDPALYMPNGQILCYPVISFAREEIVEKNSRANLFAEDLAAAYALSPELHVTKRTPPAFLWHTADDPAVPAENSMLYASALTRAGVEVEMHIFPHGYHGMGLAQDDAQVGVWTEYLAAWLSGKEKE